MSTRKICTFLMTILLIFVTLPIGVSADNNQGYTLYDTIAKQAVRDDKPSEFVTGINGIDFSLEGSDTNGKGVYTIASTLKDEYPIHYYRGEIDNNHLLYGGFCWLIVRTTDTGGIKILYNGKPTKEGSCQNVKYDSNLLYGSRTPRYFGYQQAKNASFEYKYKYENVSLDTQWYGLAHLKSYYLYDDEYPEKFSQYYYADSVTYENGEYHLINPQKNESGNSNFYKQKYACLNEKGADITSCKTVFYVLYGNDYSSHNSREAVELKDGATVDSVISELRKKQYIVGNDVKYENGEYVLLNTKKIPLLEEDSLDSLFSKDEMVDSGNYTCFSESDRCKEVYYINSKWSNSLSTYLLKNGDTIDYRDVYLNINWYDFANLEASYDWDENYRDFTQYYYADSVTYENGEYHLVNPKKKGEEDNSFYKNKYACLKNVGGKSCTNISYIFDFYDQNWNYLRLDSVTLIGGTTIESIISNLRKQKYIIGNDVKYENGEYILLDTKEVPLVEKDFPFRSSLRVEEEVGKRHYTCLNENNHCQEVYYIYDFSSYNGDRLYTYLLRKGTKIDTVLNDLLEDYQGYQTVSNETDSRYKKLVDNWYKENMVSYTQSFEDVLWCGDRSISSGNFVKDNQFFQNGSLAFSSSYRFHTGNLSLSCPNKIDTYSVQNSKGNQSLTYPVGLLTADEMSYIGAYETSFCADTVTVSMSMGSGPYPSAIDTKLPYVNWGEHSYDDINKQNRSVTPLDGCNSDYLVLPVVSLKNSKVLKGNGTPTDPYQVVEIVQLTVPNTSDGILSYVTLLVLSMLLLLGSIMGYKLRKSI